MYFPRAARPFGRMRRDAMRCDGKVVGGDGETQLAESGSAVWRNEIPAVRRESEVRRRIGDAGGALGVLWRFVS